MQSGWLAQCASSYICEITCSSPCLYSLPTQHTTSYKRRRSMREALWIRENEGAMHWDEGNYELSHIWITISSCTQVKPSRWKSLSAKYLNKMYKHIDMTYFPSTTDMWFVASIHSYSLYPQAIHTSITYIIVVHHILPSNPPHHHIHHNCSSNPPKQSTSPSHTS